MILREKIALIEDLLELEEGSLDVDTELESMDEWDSIAALSMIVLIDEEFNKTVSGKQVKSCKTVKDILDLME